MKNFEINNGTVVKYFGDERNVVIPDSIDGVLVTEIGDYAFFNNNVVETVEIPDTVTHIGDHAFYRCMSLSSISIMHVTCIDDYAFSLSGLRGIEVPDKCELGRSVFSGCKQLEDAILHKRIKVEAATFEGCTNLRNISIPEGVDCIGYNAFAGCENLDNVTIPGEHQGNIQLCIFRLQQLDTYKPT